MWKKINPKTNRKLFYLNLLYLFALEKSFVRSSFLHRLETQLAGEWLASRAQIWLPLWKYHTHHLKEQNSCWLLLGASNKLSKNIFDTTSWYILWVLKVYNSNKVQRMVHNLWWMLPILCHVVSVLSFLLLHHIYFSSCCDYFVSSSYTWWS